MVVQAPDGSLALHLKGADSAVLPRLRKKRGSSTSRGIGGKGGSGGAHGDGGHEDDGVEAAVQDHLHHFATQVGGSWLV